MQQQEQIALIILTKTHSYAAYLNIIIVLTFSAEVGQFRL